ncbi:amino acid ABC transporter ATP-binding protein [Candidatus Korarchaeum cryptofilum]|jgi:polar amino acid transport system ATP-binding protein|uniref:Amino acid ABC transporter ATP-binding protein n=1 Tax=Candidatus Korarchaeum cryptofilum TaxID=498846 RepID=A0A3R9PQ31_9CREN|nr:amino acid ABC transporter ATP-binding protein [Candidatus Korarchaeum cryptofilum]RSN67638.1 amino acid ABC transporter ATP-binding protein [Candidatus Korarchaeum cryptofilum]
MMLRIEDLRKRYSGVEVLKGVDLELRKGETKVIMGPSGAGKSTLLKCINLLVRPDGGRIFIDGEEITSKNDVYRVRQKIGFVFQEFNLFNHLTVMGNVTIGLTKVKGMSKNDAILKAKEVLRAVRIGEELWDRYPAQLSGGQKQRVAIARALAMDPVLMLYDEPTSALDPQLSMEVLSVMRELSKRGMTSLVVTHELSFAIEAASSIAVMYDGRIVEEGRPEEIIRSPKTAEARAIFKGRLNYVLV